MLLTMKAAFPSTAFFQCSETSHVGWIESSPYTPNTSTTTFLGDFLPLALSHPILIAGLRATETFLWHPTTFLADAISVLRSTIVALPPTVQILLTVFSVHRVLSCLTKDYQDHLDCGRGGTPSNFWGWWRVTRLSFMAAVDVLEPPRVPPMLEPYRGLLWDLPCRQGVRPTIRGVAPQRQADQKTPPSTFDTLVNTITAVAKANPSLLTVNTSTLEKHTISLKAKRPGPIEIPNTEGEFGHEICHPHRNDGSVHMILHPEDIKTVVDAGWGQRHPLSTSAWYWTFWFHHICRKRVPVPEFLVLIYAPRSDDEVTVVRRLIHAAVWFKTKEVPRGFDMLRPVTEVVDCY